MFIFNSLTNKKEELKTIIPKKVKMYVCGPTVYNYIHIGNARPVIFFDIVRRYLEYRGYEVMFVSNITNVDDKIIKSAKEHNVSELEIATKYTDAFFEDIRRLNVKPFDLTPKVTEYMDKIIRYIQDLVDLGYAYVADGDVYFSVNKIEEYGKLSNQETEHLEVGARITEHSKKQNALDFTLWKTTTEGIKWKSPWGDGRPGWHTECVAMISDTMGELVDIHGGGADLKFPHHENEIAQSCAKANTHLANYWMHNGKLLIDDEKMSKSLNNFILLRDFLNQYDYRILRLLMISTHYRQPLNYTIESIQLFANELDKFQTAFKKIQQLLDYHDFLDRKNEASTDEFTANVINEFQGYMDDDFNTANVISFLNKIIKEMNKATRSGEYNEGELYKMLHLYNTFLLITGVLGIEFKVERIDAETKQLITLKNNARKEKDFETADVLREKLTKRGIII